MTENRTRVATREQLLYWLHEASEIEHHLMCCYLYAAFNLKRVEARWSDAQRGATLARRDHVGGVRGDVAPRAGRQPGELSRDGSHRAAGFVAAGR